MNSFKMELIYANLHQMFCCETNDDTNEENLYVRDKWLLGSSRNTVDIRLTVHFQLMDAIEHLEIWQKMKQQVDDNKFDFNWIINIIWCIMDFFQFK